MLNAHALEWFGYAMCGYQILLWLSAPRWWKVAARLRGHFPAKEAVQMLYFVARSPISFYLYQPTLLYLIPLVLYFASNSIVLPGSILLFPLLLQTYIWAYQALPPAVLLLASSRSASFDLRYTLEHGLHPYRVVCLLDPALAAFNEDSAFRKNLFEWDNLWSVDSSSWRTIAHPLMDIADFIVVDARVATPGVTEEAARIARGPLIQKAFFVVDDGTCSALEANGLDAASPGVRAIRQEQVLPMLKSMGLTETASPDDSWRQGDARRDRL